MGVDLMGSDTPPEELAAALLELREKKFSHEFLIFASPEVLRALEEELPSSFSCIACSESIEMGDDPLRAIRQKKEASLCKGIDYLAEKRIDAFVTAGNTGALLLAAKTKLPMISHIDRPALLTLLPSHKNEVAVLDVGANLTLKSHHILQFAAMGIAYQKSRGIEHPTVGLLNIGTEAIKGTPQIREAYAKLETLNRTRPIFLGNVEGKDVFQGNIDVIVTDGFTGNIFLKTAEGVASFILQELEERAFECSPSFRTEISSFKKQLYTTGHPGAILCGVDGIVVKCHGDTHPTHFIASIQAAARLVEHRFLEKITANLAVSS